MDFAIVASGSKGNCFVLVDRDAKIMIDCGTCMRYVNNSLKELSLSASELDGVLITHDHSDHIAALKAVKEVPIYSPVELNDFQTIPVVEEQAFHIKHLRIDPIALSHDAFHTTGYVIRNEKEKLVYITDTGYIRKDVLSLIEDADYYVLESNHDVEMLMQTSRPYYLKQRILGDEGHLNNDDCAAVLNACITSKTKHIILAHLSDQANTKELCLNTTLKMLSQHEGTLSKDLIVSVAEPRKIIKGGGWLNEESALDPSSSISYLEWTTNV